VDVGNGTGATVGTGDGIDSAVVVSIAFVVAGTAAIAVLVVVVVIVDVVDIAANVAVVVAGHMDAVFTPESTPNTKHERKCSGDEDVHSPWTFWPALNASTTALYSSILKVSVLTPRLPASLHVLLTFHTHRPTARPVRQEKLDGTSHREMITALRPTSVATSPNAHA
jgi:hypothetical protein